MASATEFFNTWNDGFAKKDSSRLAELLTDDFQFVGSQSTRSRQETLDWTAGGGNGGSKLDNLEVLYENNEMAVVCHSANSIDLGEGRVMAVYTKKDGKFSHIRMVRQAL